MADPTIDPGQQSLNTLTAGHPLAVKALRELRRDAGRWLKLRNQTGEQAVFISMRHPNHVVTRLTFEYADGEVDSLKGIERADKA